MSMQYRSAVNGLMKPSPARTRQSRPAYPPPVVGTAASEMNNVFEGLDQSGWAAFVQNLEGFIEVFDLSCIIEADTTACDSSTILWQAIPRSVVSSYWRLDCMLD